MRYTQYDRMDYADGTITPLELSKIMGMSVCWVQGHRKKGLTADQILGLKRQRQRYQWADGSHAKFEEIIRRGRDNGVGWSEVFARLKAGATPEQAIDPMHVPDPASPPIEEPVTPWLHLTWDQRHMALARFWSQNSKDPSTKVGAVIVGRDKREVTLGYNGFPPGIADDERLLDRAKKYPIVIHAERNALDNCRFDTKGATLYATLAPCCGCASSIVSKGIRKVVCPQPDYNSELARRHDIVTAIEILREGGVLVEWEVPA
jgi:dCMP deaminase